MVERRDIVGYLVALVVCRSEPVVVFSGEMDDLELAGLQERGGFEKELVDAAGSLAPASDKQRGSGRIEIEMFQRLLARDGVA